MGEQAALSTDLDAMRGGAAGVVLLAEGTARAKARGQDVFHWSAAEQGAGEEIQEKQGDAVGDQPHSLKDIGSRPVPGKREETTLTGTTSALH